MGLKGESRPSTFYVGGLFLLRFDVHSQFIYFGFCIYWNPGNRNSIQFEA